MDALAQWVRTRNKTRTECSCSMLALFHNFVLGFLSYNSIPIQNFVWKTITLDQNFLIMKRCLTRLYFFAVTYAPLRHTPGAGFAILFFLAGLFPTPGHAERDNSPNPSSWWTSFTFFGTSFLSVQKQNDTFSQLLKKVFLSLLREG